MSPSTFGDRIVAKAKNLKEDGKIRSAYYDADKLAMYVRLSDNNKGYPVEFYMRRPPITKVEVSAQPTFTERDRKGLVELTEVAEVDESDQLAKIAEGIKTLEKWPTHVLAEEIIEVSIKEATEAFASIGLGKFPLPPSLTDVMTLRSYFTMVFHDCSISSPSHVR